MGPPGVQSAGKRDGTDFPQSTPASHLYTTNIADRSLTAQVHIRKCTKAVYRTPPPPTPPETLHAFLPVPSGASKTPCNLIYRCYSLS